MFGRMFKIFLILIISISLNSFSLFANSYSDSVEKYKNSEAFKNELAQKLFKHQVKVNVYVPKRHGFKNRQLGSAIVIAKEIKEAEKEENQKIIYYFLLNPHEVHDMDYVLKGWKKAGIEIFVLGKSNHRIRAEIVAWNWFAEALVIKAEVSFKQKDNFDFEPVKIADKLAESLVSKDRDYGKYETIYTSGFPRGYFVVNSAYVSEYVNDEMPMRLGNNTAILPKRMAVIYDYFGGPGQSGSGVFRVIFKVDEDENVGIERLELLGLIMASISYTEGMVLAIPIDMIVEKFLKDIPEITNLIKLPKFKVLIGIATPTNFPDQDNQTKTN